MTGIVDDFVTGPQYLRSEGRDLTNIEARSYDRKHGAGGYCARCVNSSELRQDNSRRRVSMKRLVFEAWLLLLYFESLMLFGGFKELYRIVRDEKVRPMHFGVLPETDHLSLAMNYACVFYFKRILCLQRSAATTLLFRRYGWAAAMVIGAQVLPFKSHAWVEVEGAVVNDKPYVRETYQVLDRC